MGYVPKLSPKLIDNYLLLGPLWCRGEGSLFCHDVLAVYEEYSSGIDQTIYQSINEARAFGKEHTDPHNKISGH